MLHFQKMKLTFYKYHGTGNDFIMIDAYKENIELSTEQIKHLCSRRFGVGSDGLMLVKKHHKFDFEMDYYNPDGSGATFCGNGARCIVAFAHKLGIIDKKTKFIASDGTHKATINQDIVKLEMKNIDIFSKKKDYIFMNTGSPHVVKFTENLENFDINLEGKKIRFSTEFSPIGTNVNFVQPFKNHIQVRTYEKGVENETYSCGTGVVASALGYFIENKSFNAENKINIKTKGGDLTVFFETKSNVFKNIFLQGKATFVFKGEIEI